MHFSTVSLVALLALATAAPAPANDGSASAYAYASAGAGAGAGTGPEGPQYGSQYGPQYGPQNGPQNGPQYGPQSYTSPPPSETAAGGDGASPTTSCTDTSPTTSSCSSTDPASTTVAAATATNAEGPAATPAVFVSGICHFDLTETSPMPLRSIGRLRSAYIPAVYDGASPPHVVGWLPQTAEVPDGQLYTVVSNGLPGTLTVHQRRKEIWRMYDAPVTFGYNGRTWEESSGQCQTGPWSNGHFGTRVIKCWMEC